MGVPSIKNSDRVGNRVGGIFESAVGALENIPHVIFCIVGVTVGLFVG